MIQLVNAEAGAIPLPDGVVHCSVTSPPYWSLRQYEGDQARDWPAVTYSPMPGLPPLTVEPMRCALGHEATPEAFIGHLVAVYREVWRVLREDGVAWCVIGDSYAEGRKKPGRNDLIKMYGDVVDELVQPDNGFDKQPQCKVCGRFMKHDDNTGKWFCDHSPKQYKQGDLVQIPHRLALALQGDGWVCRNDVVWAKPAPMPESVAGWSWQRHRIKIANSRRTTYARHADAQRGVNNPQSERDGPDFADQSDRFVPCPGCPACQANPADCPDCLGTGVKYSPADWSVPMSDEEHRAYCDANPCPKCGGSGKFGGYVLRRGSWRHTRSHETVLMLVKKMNYWCDQEAVREAVAQSSLDRINQPTFNRQNGGDKDYGSGINPNRSMRQTLENFANNPAGRNPRSVRSYDDPTRDLIHFIPREAWAEFLGYWIGEYNRAASNPADVLTPSPSPYAGAHYATYPPDLIRDLIRASTPARCCPECGAGWAACIDRGETSWENRKAGGATMGGHINDSDGQYQRGVINGYNGKEHAEWKKNHPDKILGYRPTCACVPSPGTKDIPVPYTPGGDEGFWAPEPVPGLVLDMFVGSGTTLEVAREEGFDAIGLDLSFDYLHNQARARLGLAALAAWYNGKDGAGADLAELPLFAEVR